MVLARKRGRDNCLKRLWIPAAALALTLLFSGCTAAKSAQTPEPAQSPTEAPTPVLTEAPTEVSAGTPTPIAAEDLLGVWTAEEFRFGNSSSSAAELGVEAYFAFRADSTVCSVQSSDAGYDELTMTFSISGNTVICHDRDGDVVGSYDPETDTIVMRSEGSEIVLVRNPDAEIPQKKAAETVVSDTPVGEWELTGAIIREQEISAQEVGQRMRFVLNEDGTAQMQTSDGIHDRITWMQDGETVSLIADRIPVLTFVFDGETLTMHLTEEGFETEMIFERVNAE